jgi:hypothetical protein
MKCELYELCAPRRLDLGHELAAALASSQADSYRELQPSELEARALRLVDAFVESLAETPARFVRHVEGIVGDRVAAGFALGEVQAALSLLEERLWRLVVDDCAAADPTPSLSRVTTTIGAAKDRLAQLYLAELQRQLVRVEQCERRLEALFRGTAEAPMPDDA